MRLLHPLKALLLLTAVLTILPTTVRAEDPDLPIKYSALKGKKEEKGDIRNLYSLKQLYDCVHNNGHDGFKIDLTGIKKLLDNSEIDPKMIYGNVYFGPYPFESKETDIYYRRFRHSPGIGAGVAWVNVKDLFQSKYNSERWTDHGQLILRFKIILEHKYKDRNLGTYDIIIGFTKDKDGFKKVPTIFEGPFVNRIQSDSRGEAVISFRTLEAATGKLLLFEKGEKLPFNTFLTKSQDRHEIALKDLDPAKEYEYTVSVGPHSTRRFELPVAPQRSSTEGSRFAYFGDSREGVGGGMKAFMGVNYETLQKHALLARKMDADFIIMGGDLVNGYTTVKADFQAQLHAWKQALLGFWSERPIYAAMGNHESLLRKFVGNIRLDRWPYDTESAEAVFAQTFCHPENGPVPSDPRRPTYKENVYSFQYGCTKLIAFNNNYWVSYNETGYGGCPEGYILPDQMEWLENELNSAEQDPRVKYVLLYAQEPIFPNGGHLADSMWYNGDNRKRAYFVKDNKVIPAEDGIVILRNKFVRMIARHKKVAAVLGSDEHAYHRTFIDRTVPIGNFPKDDRNLSGKIDIDIGETASPLTDLENGTWYVVGGGGGAPYYSEEDTPWNQHWKDKKTPKTNMTGFYFSSQENLLIFDATAEKISLKVYNPNGEIIDEIPDMMADK